MLVAERIRERRPGLPRQLMNLTLPRKVVRNFRDKGVMETARLVMTYPLRRLNEARPSIRRRLEEERSFDARYGVDTNGIINSEDLDIDDRAISQQSNGYEPTPIWVLRSILQSLPIRLEDYVFIDIGSGKGRTLLVASEHPFKKIIGAEISPALTAIANRNLQRYQHAARRCDDVESICMNALDFVFPNENLVIYIYNSFHEQLLKTVLANIELCLRRHRRDILVVYTNPVHYALLNDIGYLRLLEKTSRYRVYRCPR